MNKNRIHKNVKGERYCIKKHDGPYPLPRGIKREATNITLAPYWKQWAIEKATERGLSLSRYIEKLIYTDSMRIKSA